MPSRSAPKTARCARTVISADPAHDRDLVGVLDDPAPRGDGSTALEAQRGRLPRHRVREVERHRLVDPHAPGGDLAVAEDGGDEVPRRLVLLPGAHVRADLHLLERALLLEGRGDPGRVAFPGQDHAEEALGEAPERAREVLEAAAGGHHQGVLAVLAQEGLGARETGATLVERYGGDALGRGRERGQRRRKLLALRGRRGGKGGAERGRRRHLEERTPGDGAGSHLGHLAVERRRMLPSDLRNDAVSPPASPSSFVFALVATTAQAASFPPSYRFRTLKTARVSVHFHQGLEAMARQAATLATEILEHYEARYGRRVSRVQIVLADNEDDPNGFATPLPVSAGERARGRPRRHRRLRQPRRVAAPRPGPRARPHRPPGRGPRRHRLRTKSAGPRAVPLPERAHPDLAHRGARHLRGDGADRVRTGPQPGLAHGPAHGRARGPLPRRGPGDLWLRPLAGRPGPLPLRAGLPAPAQHDRGGADPPEARAQAVGQDHPVPRRFHRPRGDGLDVPRALEGLERSRRRPPSRRKRRGSGATGSRSRVPSPRAGFARPSLASARTAPGSPTRAGA